MKIGIIQQHNTADRDDNRQRLAEGIKNLAQQGAELVVLQELHNSLYFCLEEDVNSFELAEPIPGTAVVLEKDGTIAGKYRKMHIPDDPGYYEKFYFTPGDLGFKPIQTSVGRLGVLVCWDQWYPEAARLMALQGAELLIYPTAIGFDPNDTPEEQQRQRMAWQTVQRGHAVANGLPVVTVNRVGTESQIFWGTSFVAGPQGELLYEASADKEEQAVVEVDLRRSEQVRRWWPFLRDRRIDEYGELTKRYVD